MDIGQDREQKHLVIRNAASRLIRGVDELECLLNAVSPRPSAEEEAKSQPGNLSLGDYLSSEANRLEYESIRFEKLLDELKKVLF